MRDPESTEPRGTVTDQMPPGGEPHDQGTVVTLFVSTYEPPPPPPTPTETAPPLPTETPDRAGQFGRTSVESADCPDGRIGVAYERSSSPSYAGAVTVSARSTSQPTAIAGSSDCSR